MPDLTEDRKILQHEIYEEMKTSYIDYSMSVIVARALPDVRDGLKPVHRRILYGLDALGITPDKPHKKSARIVGEVMGKYHPHGDASIYDAMVRLAQPWNMRYRLVDGHGNFGSMDGDGAAASRYTEARMAPFALEIRRLRRQLRRRRKRTRGAARQIPQSAGQRRQRHRSRYGHRHSAP